MSTYFQSKSKVFIDPDEGWRRQVYFDAEIDIVPSHWFDEEDNDSQKWLDDSIEDDKDTPSYDESEEKLADRMEHIDDNTRKYEKSKKDKLTGAKFDDKTELVEVKEKVESMKTKVNGLKCRLPVKSRPKKFYTTIMNCVVQLIIGNVTDGKIKSTRKALSDPKIQNSEEPVEIAEDALDRLPLNVSDIRKQFMSGNKSERSEHQMETKSGRNTEKQQSKKDLADTWRSGKVKALSAIFDKGKDDEVATLDPLRKNKLKEHRLPRRLMG